MQVLERVSGVWGNLFPQADGIAEALEGKVERDPEFPDALFIPFGIYRNRRWIQRNSGCIDVRRRTDGGVVVGVRSWGRRDQTDAEIINPKVQVSLADRRVVFSNPKTIIGVDKFGNITKKQ